MSNLVPGLIIGFREGLEAFLIIAVVLRFLDRAGRADLRKSVWLGAGAGVILSAIVGIILFLSASLLGGAGRAAKIWESAASLAALVLVTTFIVWMIKHGSEIKGAVENSLKTRLSGLGVGSIVLAMVLREGTEIALFSFAGSYPAGGVALGVLAAGILVTLVFLSLVKVNLATIFNVTLGYLILQAGFLLGYGIHEGLSALKDAGVLAATNPVFIKAFNLAGTVLDHKEGAIGIPLYALAGWYSRPEWVQFLAQYAYTFILLGYWLKRSANKAVRG